MVGRPQVSIRLGTSGKGEVKKDFAEIGDAGSAAAQRYAAAFERSSADVERALERQAKAAARLSTVSTTPVQQQINSATGVGAGATGNARASAAALAAELDRAEREANQLIAAIDPLFAAQQRYATNVARLNELKALGVLQGTRYAQLLEVEEQALDSATQASLRNSQARGAQRIGMQQLSFQVGDIAQQYALGTRAGVIFAQQSGQVVQALQLMGGEGNKFLRFLGSGWGIGISAAVVVLVPLIGKLFEGSDAVGDLTDKLEKQAKQARDQETANRVWAASLDGVTEALRVNREALDKQKQSALTAGQETFKQADIALINAKNLRIETDELLRNAEAQLARQQAILTGVSSPQAREFAAQNLDSAQQRVTQLKADLATVDGQISDAQKQLTEARATLFVEAVDARDDPVERIKLRYDGLVQAARNRAAAEGKVGDELARQITLLRSQERAEVKAAQRETPRNAGGTAIFDAQIASFFDTAAKYRGLTETRDKSVLQALFSEANQTLDPEKTAWCAAFVNAVLAANGVRGSGSLLASSFLNFGKDDMRSPQKGDIAVVKSSGSASGQHVGFVESVDAKGNVRVLGGNTADKVGTGIYAKNEILAIRRPPTPSEAARSSETAADKALKAQNDYEEQLARLRVEMLQATSENVLGAQAQAKAARDQVDAEEKAALQKIQSNLSEGKYGEATSQLAQERAKQLTDAVEQTAAQKRITLQTRNLAQSLQDGDQRLSQLAQFHVDELRYQDSIARSSAEHRRIQLEIIDAVYEEKKRHLEVARNLALMAGEYAEAARIQDQINNLPAERGREQEDAKRGTMTPWQAYLDTLPKSIDAIDEQLEKAAVGGLEKFNDGLLDVLLHSKSIGDAWHNLGGLIHNVAAQILADLLRLAEQEAVMALFGNGQQGASGGGGGALGSIIGAIGSIAGAFFGGGGPAPGTFSGVDFGSNPVAGPMGMAVGTPSHSGGAVWVGENGKELVDLPRGSRIYTAAESRRMAAANDAGPRLSLSFQNDFRGADPAAVDAIKVRLDQLQSELPGLVVQHWTDARARFLIRV